MGKTITIDYKGGSRQVELQRPPEKKMIYRLAMAPVPIRMDYESLDWINGTLAMGTDIPREQIEDMDITAGYPLFNDVINYWREVVDPDYDDSQVEELIEGMELNEDGSVDLEEMQ